MTLAQERFVAWLAEGREVLSRLRSENASDGLRLRILSEALEYIDGLGSLFAPEEEEQ